MVKVNNSVKIPLKEFLGKGSYEKRIEHAKEINAQFYQVVESKMLNGMLPVNEYKKTLQEFLPSNIKVKFKTYVKKFLGQDDAYVTTLMNDNDELDKFEIQIPCREYINKQRVIEKKDNNVSMHEMLHLFFAISNPKHTVRSCFNSTEYKFYEANIYTNMHSQFKLKDRLKWKKNLMQFLAKKSYKTQIDFLQNSRYRLLEEKLAYLEGEKYGNPDYMSKFFYFDEKIKIIEKMLYKTIKKARKENKKS